MVGGDSPSLKIPTSRIKSLKEPDKIPEWKKRSWILQHNLQKKKIYQGTFLVEALHESFIWNKAPKPI
jgi:hypothetical protein